MSRAVPTFPVQRRHRCHVSGKLADAAILDLALLHTESASLTTSQIHSPTESTASLPFQSSYSADRMLAASEVQLV
ncbi:hypothetical protein B5M09_013210 [Aphanomyces astaci]|uniref:Uncharacterized protein n=1 Tax=Aphanomyces astaci TaxID=112090 RepID=A0A3R7YJB8_APHAT|nr:hypothetical protein B5M09_013210 [Aphanomyces astaci]